MIIPYKPRLVLALLLAVLAMTAFSLLLFHRIDNIVHIDLYRYGLQFNYGWADQYWSSSNLYLYCQMLALILLGNSIAFFFSHIRNRNAFSSYASSFLLFAGAGLSILSLYFLFRLDFIINNDFYSYGLTFSAEWYTNYSFNFRLLLLLVVLAALVALVSAVVLYSSTRRAKIIPAKLISSTLIANGTLALALSIVYSSSILALIGLGLLFWGITFIYIGGGDDRVKRVILEATVLSQMATLNQLLKTLGFVGNPVYLPPRYFKNSSTNAVYIQKIGNTGFLTPEIMPRNEPSFLFEFIENPASILMTPPGAQLVQLFEKTLKTNFNKVDLKYLQQNLPELLVEELEITQQFEMEIETNKIRIRTIGSIYNNSNAQTEQPSILSLFGSPLSSAIACS